MKPLVKVSMVSMATGVLEFRRGNMIPEDWGS